MQLGGYREGLAELLLIGASRPDTFHAEDLAADAINLAVAPLRLVVALGEKRFLVGGRIVKLVGIPDHAHAFAIRAIVGLDH